MKNVIDFIHRLIEHVVVGRELIFRQSLRISSGNPSFDGLSFYTDGTKMEEGAETDLPR